VPDEHRVWWRVGRQRCKQRYKTRALADSFRSELMTAARKGEPFDVDTGLPASMGSTGTEMSWYEFACTYMDMKWGPAAATYRRSISEALTAITPALFGTEQGRPDAAVIRKALHRWAFNTSRRADPDMPADVRAALRWVEQHTKPVARFAEPEVLRLVLDTVAAKLDGTPAAGSVVSKRRRVLFNIMEYAVERKLLVKNPIPGFKWSAPKAVTTVDKRSVVNPVQARVLLDAVRETKRSGPRLVAFFGLMYFAALRPEEAATLRKGAR
jgi:hypothetical protein